MKEWEWQLLEDKFPLETVEIAGVVVRRGDRVKLHPRPRGDVLDVALNGKIAVIESIEQDYEGIFHVCVVLDDDPGRDIGLMRQPGHRFFFATDEVEPLPRGRQIAAPSISAADRHRGETGSGGGRRPYSRRSSGQLPAPRRR